MDNLLNQKYHDTVLLAPGNSVDIETPTINIDTNQENNGINSSNVEEARIYLSQLRLNNAPEDEQRQGEIYLSKLQQQAAENETGTNLHHQRLRESTIEIRQNVDLLNLYLLLDEHGQPHEAHNVNFDLGNPALNQMYALIRNDFNRMDQKFTGKIDEMDQKFTRKFNEMDQKFTRKFNEMDQKFTRKFNEMDKKFTGKFNEMDQKFTRQINEIDKKFTGKFNEMDQKFTGVEKLIVSERNRSKNKLLADGGDLYSPNAYLPIFNDCGESPGDRGLEPLTSLTQIDRMNGILIDNYLTFYQIGTSRLVSEKKARLMEYIGIHERVVVNSVRAMSPV